MLAGLQAGNRGLTSALPTSAAGSGRDHCFAPGVIRVLLQTGSMEQSYHKYLKLLFIPLNT